jgi:hypothetical protein
MRQTEKLNQMIQQYIAFVLTLKRESLVQKLLMDKRESDGEHPAHMAFYEAVGQWTREFAAGDPSQEELTQALELLLLTAEGYKNQMPYWYLMAIQGYAANLIPLLQEDRKQRLCKAFEAQYPRNKQLPVQKDIDALLRGEKRGKRKSFLSFLRR